MSSAGLNEAWRGDMAVMGLGLAITRRLIELHGGEIGVRSTGVDETGSTFYFRLPVLKLPSPKAKLRGSRHNTVLLLVEKGSTSPDLQQHLAEKGFEVEVMPVSQEHRLVGPGRFTAPGCDRDGL